MSTRAGSGARLAIFKDGIEIGFCVGGSWEEARNVVAIDTLNDPWTKAFELTGITCGGSLSKVFILGNDMGEQTPQQYPNMATDKVGQLLFQPSTIVFYDTVTEKAVCALYGAVFINRSGNVDRNSVMMENVTFRARRFETFAFEAI